MRTAPPLVVPLLVAAALVLAPASARAQSASAIGVGLSCGVTEPTSASADADIGPELALRLRGGEGIGPAVGFNWFSSPVRTTLAGERVYLGKVRVKPLMAGVSYSRVRSRMKADVSLEAGYAFVDVRGTGQLKQAYGRLGAVGVGVRGSDTFAWRGKLTVWFDLGSHYGLMASAGYLGVRPAITTTSSLGSTRQRAELGSFITSFGFAYGVF